MRATRLIYKLRNKSYEERLRTLALPTLKYRRLRGDTIETYKILSGKYDVSVSPVIPLVTETVTRSNTLKIRNRRTHSKIDLISTGCNRVLNIIVNQKYLELGVESRNLDN